MTLTEFFNPPKGKYSWVVGLFEVIIVLAYFGVFGYYMYNAFTEVSSGNLSLYILGLFDMIKGTILAVIWLMAATVINTILCFIPIFRSKANTWTAIWNIIWLIWLFI